LNAGLAVQSIGRLSELRARKELLDQRSDAPTVLALLAADRQSQADATAAPADERELKEGMAVNIQVQEDSDLNARAKVQADGTILYPPLGAIPAAGLTANDLAKKIKEDIENKGLVKRHGYMDQFGKYEPSELAGAKTPATVSVTVDQTAGKTEDAAGASVVTRSTLGALGDAESQKLFM